MRERTSIRDVAQILNAAWRFDVGPIAFTTAELDVIAGGRSRGLPPFQVFGYPVVEVVSWPRWMETAARYALDPELSQPLDAGPAT